MSERAGSPSGRFQGESPLMTKTSGWMGAASLAACWFALAAQAASYAWIGHDSGVAAIDVEAQRVVVNIARTDRVRDVAAIPGSRHVFAVLNGVVAKIDGDALAIVEEQQLFPPGPAMYEIEMKPGRDEAYLRISGTNDVQVLRTDVLSVIGSVNLPGAGDPLRSAPAFDRIAGRAFFPAGAGVAELDAASNQVIRTLPYTPATVEAHPQTRRLYLAANDTLQLLDLDSGSIIATRTIPGAGLGDARVNPAGTRLLVTDPSRNLVHVLDAGNLQVMASLAVGAQPRGIDVTASGDLFVVVNEGGIGVSIVDATIPAVVGTVPVGTQPRARGRFVGGSAAVEATLPGPATGLWWNRAEPGWGLHLTQRRSTFFAVLYHYDQARASKWFVAPNCTMNTPCPNCVDGVVCQGAIYETNGPAFFHAASFSPSAVQRREVGVMELQFADRDRARLTYVIAGAHRSVQVERQRFAPAAVLATDYTDLWWNPLESGWGIGIAQQSNVMFLAWFVYDESGRPTWLVASSCAVSAPGNGCRGDLYRTSGATGPAPATFDFAAVNVTRVGTIEVAFENAFNGVVSYTVDGRSGVKAITRQLF